MSKLQELRDKRGKLIHEARAILDQAEAEKRGMTAEEEANYNGILNKQEDLRKGIEREERQAELERDAAREVFNDSGAGKGEQRMDKDSQGKAYRAALLSYMRGGRATLSMDEVRALSAGTDTQGGYFIGEQMASELIKAVDDMVFIRSRATVIPIPTASSLGAVSLDSDPDDADWTTELATGSEDSTMAFGKRKLEPHPFAKRIKLSNELLRKVPGIEGLVRQRLAYKFGITEEKSFLTGSGNMRPLGLFTASNDGITTARDISTGNTTTAITFDGLITAKYTLKGQYHARAAWMFHRDAMAMISKLKDGEGQYLWRPSVREGEPDRVLGFPYDMSEYVPNTFTTGLYVGILGDFSHYWIADAMDITIQRLEELYAESNQTGLIVRASCDGMPTLAEAFVRVKLA